MKYADLKRNFEGLISIGRPFAPRLVATFTANSLPVISCNDVAIVNLAEFRSQLEKLRKGDVFVMGRDVSSDHHLPKSFKKTDSRPTGVSRFHCFIKKGKDESFELFDTSATFTAVCLE